MQPPDQDGREIRGIPQEMPRSGNVPRQGAQGDGAKEAGGNLRGHARQGSAHGVGGRGNSAPPIDRFPFDGNTSASVGRGQRAHDTRLVRRARQLKPHRNGEMHVAMVPHVHVHASELGYLDHPRSLIQTFQQANPIPSGRNWNSATSPPVPLAAPSRYKNAPDAAEASGQRNGDDQLVICRPKSLIKARGSRRSPCRRYA